MSQAADFPRDNANHIERLRNLTRTLGCADIDSSADLLQRMLDLNIASELFEVCFQQLSKILPGCPNPDRGLANLVRYVEASRSPQALLALFERDREALPILMRILATSQSWAEQLIADPESFDLLRLTEGLPVSRNILIDELATEIADCVDPQQVSQILRTHKQRETMRIAYGDFIGALPLETVTQQLSTLAESIIEAALKVAIREARSKFGETFSTEARLSVISLGQLGGNELSYSRKLDILFLCESAAFQRIGPANSPATDISERIARRVIQLLSDSSFGPALYNISVQTPSQTVRGSLTATVESALQYFENRGQTWQRQAFIKGRHVAGDPALASDFLTRLEPWVYRRYLSRADISEIASLKRVLTKRVSDNESPTTNLNRQPGGVRDVEFLIQYLQLVNGGELTEIRTGNTLEAILALMRVGCLTAQEQSVLEDNYRFLRQLEHRLQIVIGQDAESLPDNETDALQFLLAAGYATDNGQRDPHSLLEALYERTKLNSRILNHLLSETYLVDSGQVAEETDLVLDASPSPALIERVMTAHRFADAVTAYRQLVNLGQEQVSFLSSRRCKHFLSAIAPRLLHSMSQTPSPDLTLAILGRVADSLGGKAVLWELLSTIPPAMDLCVRLCAASPYLVGVLTNNPGMIDELIDSLMLDRLPGSRQIEDQVVQLCHGVEDPVPVLHSFKNSMHLQIGTRDILGKDEIVDTHRALSDVAETCLKQMIEHEYHRLVQKLGVPTVTQGPRAGQPTDLIVLAVGKLGGREPNYHSDLDVMFLYDGEGTTQSLLPNRRQESTSNRTFFNHLANRVVKSITRVGPSGQLYELDAQLRPLGGIGSAVSFDDLKDYFCNGHAQLWERLALCKARAVWASPAIVPKVTEGLRAMLLSLPWRADFATEILRLRSKLEQGAARTNIKRGRGGTLDIEFIVQMLQLRHLHDDVQILVPGTIDALDRLQNKGFLNSTTADVLGDNYRFLRRVESGLRLMNLPARHDLPTTKDELDQLQFLLRDRFDTTNPHNNTNAADIDRTHPLNAKCAQVRTRNRQIFEEIVEGLTSVSSPRVNNGG